MTMRLKAVFFDAAGTLIKTVRPVGESYALFASKYDCEIPPVEISQRFQICFASAPPLAFPEADAKDIPRLEREWWKELVRRIFEPWGPFARFEDYFSELFAYFSKPEAWSLYGDVEETLTLLRERKLILDVISNFDSRLLGILEGLGIAGCFDNILISSRVGFAKPAPEIFHSALQLHSLKGEETLHVGDSPDKDAAAASSAGLTGVLLDRKGKASSNRSRRVRDLKGVLPLIDGRA